MALAATITVDPRRGLTSISPLIYGQFLEHFHRQVFGGAFEPGSPLADGRGFRLWPNASDSDATAELACGLRVVPPNKRMLPTCYQPFFQLYFASQVGLDWSVLCWLASG